MNKKIQLHYTVTSHSYTLQLHYKSFKYGCIIEYTIIVTLWSHYTPYIIQLHYMG